MYSKTNFNMILAKAKIGNSAIYLIKKIRMHLSLSLKSSIVPSLQRHISLIGY